MKSQIAMMLWLVLGSVHAGVSIDAGFWETYRPYQQYGPETLRDLIELREGDLLETAREIDGLELRLIGRESPSSALLSARVVIDSVARERLQIKTKPRSLSPGDNRDLRSTRRLLTADQAAELVRLLERIRFWDAPYRAEDQQRSQANCANAGSWIVEGYKPGIYQLIARTDCGTRDTLVSEIREFLLDLAGLAPAGGNLR